MKRQNTNGYTARFLVCTMALAGAAVMTSASSASAQSSCPPPSTESSTVSICGRVFDDTNSDKVQDSTEPYIGGPDATVVAENTVTNQTYTGETAPCDPMYPDSCGYYEIIAVAPGTYDVCVIKYGQPVTCDGSKETQTVTVTTATGVTVPGIYQDIGRPGATGTDDGPGTGTPGYWKNHSEAWPTDNVTIGGVVYTKAKAISLMGKVGGDKSITIFSSLLSAKLNVMIGNPTTCVAQAIADGDKWFATYVAVMPGKIAGSSPAWVGVGQGDAIHQVLDNYNNGLLGAGCGHHRN